MQKQRGRTHLLTLWLSGCAALFFSGFCNAAGTASNTPLIPISIIIDDLGDLHQKGLRAVHLPGKVTYAFLPHTPYSKLLARTAHHLGKEVMVHMPMESMGNLQLGRGGLTLRMTRQEFTQTLKTGIATVPHASGLNNHMGSLLTRHPGHMQWLMTTLKEMGPFYFIDSRTTNQTVALQLARENQIPARQRDIFLDDDASPAAVAEQFKRLIKQAKKNGSAVAIGHPYDATLTLLEEQLPRLETLGLKLVPISELLNIRKAPEQHLTDDIESNNDNEKEHIIYNSHLPAASSNHLKASQ